MTTAIRNRDLDVERTDMMQGCRMCAFAVANKKEKSNENVGRPNERRSARVHTLPRADEPMPLQQIMLLFVWPRRHHRLRMHSACTSATQGLRQVCRT